MSSAVARLARLERDRILNRRGAAASAMRISLGEGTFADYELVLRDQTEEGRRWSLARVPLTAALRAHGFELRGTMQVLAFRPDEELDEMSEWLLGWAWDVAEMSSHVRDQWRRLGHERFMMQIDRVRAVVNASTFEDRQALGFRNRAWTWANDAWTFSDEVIKSARACTASGADWVRRLLDWVPASEGGRWMAPNNYSDRPTVHAFLDDRAREVFDGLEIADAFCVWHARDG